MSISEISLSISRNCPDSEPIIYKLTHQIKKHPNIGYSLCLEKFFFLELIAYYIDRYTDIRTVLCIFDFLFRLKNYSKDIWGLKTTSILKTTLLEN